MRLLNDFVFLLAGCGILIGIFGEPTFLLCGCILLGSALISTSIQSLRR